MFVLKNGQPELVESSQLTFRKTLEISPGTGQSYPGGKPDFSYRHIAF